MKRLVWLAVILALLPVAGRAQKEATSGANPVSDSVRQFFQWQSKNLTAAAEEMPADKYNYHPTPAQMTFAHLLLHIAGSNYFLCSQIAAAQKPEVAKLSDTDPKDKLVPALRSSFDYCGTVLAKADDSNLSAPVKLFGGRTATRAMAMVTLAQDWADHYAAAAIYLRLNGLLPPTAQAHKKE